MTSIDRLTKNMVTLSTIESYNPMQFKKFTQAFERKFKKNTGIKFDLVMRKDISVLYDISVDKFTYNQIKQDMDKFVVDFIGKSSNLVFA